MSRKRNPIEIVRELALGADSVGLTEFDVHGMIRDAFREVHELHLKHLDKWWDATFEQLGRTGRDRACTSHVQQTGGERTARPIKEFTSGSVRAAIWKNEYEKDGQKFTTHVIRVERTYKDADGSWQATNGFRQADLPNLELLARKAFEFLSMREREPQDEENRENPEV